jgi:adenylosuccinate synthase
MSGATIIVGAQWGDEGKGLISAYLGMRDNPKYVARAGTGPNAEHGIFLKDEKTYLKTNQLPLGCMFNPKVEVRVGSGVAVDPVKLIAEIEKYSLHGRVKIDYRCPIVTQEHIDGEINSAHNQAIGSTMSGTGLCRRDFVQRIAKQAKDFPELGKYLTDTAKDINLAARTDNIIVESSQGTFLSLAVSPDYPNVTSDNVTAMAAADDVLLNWKHIKDVILIVKALPTREGAGGMGNVEEMSQDVMVERGFVEPSSIGGTTRRKAYGIDWDMLQYAVEINGATQIALTFLDHYDSEMTNVIDKDKITAKTWDLIAQISRKTQVPVTILNTGKSYDRIIDLSAEDSISWNRVNASLLKI